ncbi:MAG: DUF2948 family protein [Halocynthiibacter sp.]
MTDARFEESYEKPLNLGAVSLEDVQYVSALVQDAVLPVGEIRYQKSRRQFALLLNRFRWEHEETDAKLAERVQSVLLISDVTSVETQGIDPSEKETILSLLSLEFDAGDDGAGRFILTFAGDGALAVSVECIDLTLKDVTRPYLAPSKQRPTHSE